MRKNCVEAAKLTGDDFDETVPNMEMWIPAGALWWLALYAALGALSVLVIRKDRSGLKAVPRGLLPRGELGLLGLMLAASTALDVCRSGLPTQLILGCAAVLGVVGLMAASAWREDYSRGLKGMSNSDVRTSVDSRKLLFLVFSVAFTTEVLLEHSVGAWQR
jgi:hypothetical protein